jgi:peroxiredoxin
MKLPSSLLALAFLALTSSGQVTQPAFAALDMNGARVDTAALRGKIVVINLWFVNCPNCIEEIGQLNQLVDEYKGNQDVVFLGLAASPKPLVEKFLAKNPFKYQIIPNAQMIILGKFGTPDKNGEINVPFPMHFMLDRGGKIVIKGQGSKTIEPLRIELKRQLGAKTIAD